RVVDVPVDKQTGEHRVEVADVVLERERDRASIRGLARRGRRGAATSDALLASGTSGEDECDGAGQREREAGGTHSRGPPPGRRVSWRIRPPACRGSVRPSARPRCRGG